MTDVVETSGDAYKVQLDAYSGPLDLLLFLIRRDEVDIYDIPVAEVTKQYIGYVHLLREIDPEAVSEFLVLAATLMEIKSRMLLPTPPPEEVSTDAIDPRQDLVRQLLEYKRFKDAARQLEHSAEVQAAKFARAPAPLGLPEDEVELDSVDVWDLFHAFKRLLEQVGKAGPVHKVKVDDTPIALHAEDILDSIERSGGVQKFEEVFSGRTRPEMIGLFLALLELIRQKRIRVNQDRPFGSILVHLVSREPLDEAVMVEGWEQESPGRIGEAVSASADEVLPAVRGPLDEMEFGDATEPEDERVVLDFAHPKKGRPSEDTAVDGAAEAEEPNLFVEERHDA